MSANTSAAAKLNVKNRTLFIRDNVDILDNLNTGTVDLVYLDPPFNSNRMYSAPIGSRAAGASFKDAWTLSDIDLAWIGQISEKHPALASIIDAAGMAGGKGDKSYLSFMARRLLEIRRIIKPSGSVYLHCDATMSHSLKLVMDCIFGKKNFHNEIVWHYGGPSKIKTAFPRKQDVVFLYSKEKDYYFSPQYGELPGYLFDRARKDGDDRLWVDQNLGNVSEALLKKMKKEGRTFTTKTGKLRRKQYLDEMHGAQIDAVWDIPVINSQSRERTGYPTQKPLALLERIVKASSNKGDIILDPFCGCATAMVAAEKLGRQWIGVDISDTAVHLIKERLESDENLFEFAKKIIVRADIPARTDNGAIMVNPKEYKHTLYGMQTGDCAGCGRHFPFVNLTVDHIQPRAGGGQNIPGNLQLLCGFCNSVKGGREMPYLLAELKKRGIVK